MKYLSRNAARSTEVSKVDLTPMLDMVFILIIFFIVSASFTQEPGVTINRPKSTPPVINETNTITPVFTLTSTDTIQHQSYPVEIGAVSAIAKRLNTQDADQSIILRINDDASQGAFIAVYDQLRLGGFDTRQIAIVSFAD